jgi:uncharacterized membrane protein YadS
VDGSVDCRRYNAPTSSEVAGLMPGEWMGWLHVYFLVPHFVLFFMVLAILIAMFLDNTFLPSSKQLSRLCLYMGLQELLLHARQVQKKNSVQKAHK